MKTFLLFWNPDNSWYDLESLAYRIEDGMCGEFGYTLPWRTTLDSKLRDGDRFLIICTRKTWPKGNMIYDNLKSSSQCYMCIGPHAEKFYDLDGICFGGFFTSDPYEEDFDGKKEIVIGLQHEFAILPGLFPNIHLSRLKNEIPDFDWTHKSGEFLIEGEDENKFLEIISEWMMTSGMERSDFTNFTERDLQLAHDNLFGDQE